MRASVQRRLIRFGPRSQGSGWSLARLAVRCPVSWAAFAMPVAVGMAGTGPAMTAGGGAERLVVDGRPSPAMTGWALSRSSGADVRSHELQIFAPPY